jgi:hypothetical protein
VSRSPSISSDVPRFLTTHGPPAGPVTVAACAQRCGLHGGLDGGGGRVAGDRACQVVADDQHEGPAGGALQRDGELVGPVVGRDRGQRARVGDGQLQVGVVGDGGDGEDLGADAQQRAGVDVGGPGGAGAHDRGLPRGAVAVGTAELDAAGRVGGGDETPRVEGAAVDNEDAGDLDGAAGGGDAAAADVDDVGLVGRVDDAQGGGVGDDGALAPGQPAGPEERQAGGAERLGLGGGAGALERGAVLVNEEVHELGDAVARDQVWRDAGAHRHRKVLLGLDGEGHIATRICAGPARRPRRSCVRSS